MALSFIPFAFPGVGGVRCAFQTRHWGVSEGPYAGGNIGFSVGDDPLRVSANRLDLAASLGLAAFAEARQVHGDTLICDPPAAPLGRFVEPPAFPEADGLATDRPGFGLVIKTADCQPVLVADREGRRIAAFHIGWRGNRARFLQSGLAAFCARYGLAARDLFAVRGPSLGPARSEFVNYASEWGPDFTGWYDASARTMNLWRLTRDQLMEAGLPGDQIFGLDLCTASLPDAFFSYRRDGVCGRQAAVIWIEADARLA